MPGAVGQQADPPQVDVLQAGLLHAFVQPLLQRFGGPPFGKTAFLDVPRVAEVHLVAAATQGFGIGQDFLPAAGVDVVDAPLDTAGDDVGPILLELRTPDVHRHPARHVLAADHLVDAFPVTAQGRGRDHQVRAPATAVFHVRVVVQDLAGVFGGRVACQDRLGRGQAGGERGRRGSSGAVTDELTARETFGHGWLPEIESGNMKDSRGQKHVGQKKWRTGAVQASGGHGAECLSHLSHFSALPSFCQNAFPHFPFADWGGASACCGPSFGGSSCAASAERSIL